MGEQSTVLGWNKFTDQDWRQAYASKRVPRFCLAVGRNERRHPEAAIEGAEHLPFVETANRSEPGENRLGSESVEIERDGETVVQRARQIVRVAAARDMSKRVDASSSL